MNIEEEAYMYAIDLQFELLVRSVSQRRDVAVLESFVGPVPVLCQNPQLSHILRPQDLRSLLRAGLVFPEGTEGDAHILEGIVGVEASYVGVSLVCRQQALHLRSYVRTHLVGAP